MHDFVICGGCEFMKTFVIINPHLRCHNTLCYFIVSILMHFSEKNVITFFHFLQLKKLNSKIKNKTIENTTLGIKKEDISYYSTTQSC